MDLTENTLQDIYYPPFRVNNEKTVAVFTPTPYTNKLCNRYIKGEAVNITEE